MTKISQLFTIALLSLRLFSSHAQDTLKTTGTQAVLYVGKGENQPLIVGLGGSEGGNAWASPHWKNTRDQFPEKGYAFLAIGYFGVKGAPKVLDKIAIEAIHDAIIEATKHPRINKMKIAIVGGSRGADLALLIGSYYQDIKCVVGLMPSHAVFPGHTEHLSSSCWTFQNKELAFVPVNEEAVPFLMKRDLRGAFETMLKDTLAEHKALIKVENINGPILLLSATDDEICPSAPMSEKIIARLREKRFTYFNQHLAITGKHTEPLNHFDRVFTFLNTYFPAK
ncbi:acyl-CoA thioester hydrolase/BAAT C-terminal domain-containing protein [Runella sp.]|uniref:acyl-CoA thioester hydrolase/BAAT C-terminal domain-containing protein n=1 Tax=Runella sp. TaxID=1960881 RepID=UPI003D099C8F